MTQLRLHNDANVTTTAPGSPAPIPGAPTVLHVRVVAGAGGGPDKTIMHSAAYGHAAGVRVAAAYIHPAGDPQIETLRRRAAELNCPFFAVPESGPLDPRTIRAMLQICRNLRVSIWHAHDYKSNLLGLILRRLWPMRLLTTAHGWTRETRRTRLYYHVDRLCLRHYDHAIAVSRPLADACRASGVREEKLSLLPNAIDLGSYAPWAEIAPARAALAASAEAGERPLVIGVVGRLSPEKGVDRAIRTFAELLAAHGALELHIVGDGPERPALESLAAELGVAGSVRFLGWQAQTREHFATMDLLLLSSHSEGLPNVVLEAMAQGVPVAATDVGDVRDVLDDGVCGLLLDEDRETWAKAISPLLASAELRLALARWARQRVESQYNFKRRAHRELTIYRRLLSVVEAQAPLRKAA
ncbi:MAG: glycosyltransferase [Planctomycetota bacterium]|nr:glycosyltransferase [Planctomycetota bacterium]